MRNHTNGLACLSALILSACADSSPGVPGQADAGSCVAPPALSQPLPTLQDSLVCYSDLASAARNPVLLVPGTTLDPEPNFDWNYMPALEDRGWPYCAVTLPERAMGDIFGLGLILGGALGNILDRILFGYVIDYADLHFGTFRPFLIFNVADAAITIGVLIILARSFFLRDKSADKDMQLAAKES